MGESRFRFNRVWNTHTDASSRIKRDQRAIHLIDQGILTQAEIARLLGLTPRALRYRIQALRAERGEV